MAVVKFASDKDYQVFIDMEIAGKVMPGSMLKVSLETGEYLIQINRIPLITKLKKAL